MLLLLLWAWRHIPWHNPRHSRAGQSPRGGGPPEEMLAFYGVVHASRNRCCHRRRGGNPPGICRGCSHPGAPLSCCQLKSSSRGIRYQQLAILIPARVHPSSQMARPRRGARRGRRARGVSGALRGQRSQRRGVWLKADIADVRPAGDVCFVAPVPSLVVVLVLQCVTAAVGCLSGRGWSTSWGLLCLFLPRRLRRQSNTLSCNSNPESYNKIHYLWFQK